MLLAWTPALSQEEDPNGVFFSGGTGEGYRYTSPEDGKELGCQYGDSFNIEIDVYWLGVGLSKNVTLTMEEGDGDDEDSYEGNNVSGVIFNPPSPVNVPNALDLPSNWDPSDPHADVNVTIPLAGLSLETYYYRVHAQDGGASNLYFSFEYCVLSPVANFAYSSPSPVVGETVTFNASDSYDPDGTIVSYSWDFGDDNTSSGVTATNVFVAEGNYTVVLTVTDDDGLNDTDTQIVEVLAAPPPSPPPPPPPPPEIVMLEDSLPVLPDGWYIYGTEESAGGIAEFTNLIYPETGTTYRAITTINLEGYGKIMNITNPRYFEWKNLTSSITAIRRGTVVAARIVITNDNNLMGTNYRYRWDIIDSNGVVVAESSSISSGWIGKDSTVKYRVIIKLSGLEEGEYTIRLFTTVEGFHLIPANITSVVTDTLLNS